MTKPSDVFRAALAARSPSPEEARADLEKILARARRRRSGVRVALLAAAALGAVAAVVLTHGGRGREPLGIQARAPDHAVRIYVRRADEPESAALSLTLAIEGDR